MIMCRLTKETVAAVAEKGRIFEVGGAVRDSFLTNTPVVKDRDYLVTGIPYEQLTTILKQFGRVDLVGRSFGVIKFTQFLDGDPHTFDLTLPRKEFSTGSGHTDFEVDFDPELDVADDLSRRDFTVNAMAIALDNDELIDPLDGRADIEKRQLRMVSQKSFEEDPLRMLRAVQFSARFEFDIEPNTLAAMTKHSDLIATVSPERIAEELTKLLELSKLPSVGFRLMEQTGLLKHILPELQKCVGVDQPGGYHAHTVFEHIILTIDSCPATLRLRLAALFHDITKPQAKRLVEGGATFYGHESTGSWVAKKALDRLRFPNDLSKQVQTLVERHMFTTDVRDKGLRRLIRRVGTGLIYELLDLRRADVIAQGMGGTTEDVDQFEKDIRDEIARKPPFSLSDLQLDGKGVMEMFNLEPGPAVGKILDHLMEKVLDNPQDNYKEMLESLARKFYLTINDQNIDYIDCSDKDSKE